MNMTVYGHARRHEHAMHLVLYGPNDKPNRLRWWLVSSAVSLTPWCHKQRLRAHGAGHMCQAERR